VISAGVAAALDDAEHDSRTATELLDGSPDTFERARFGLAQGCAGPGTRLDDL
jgi:hypothetical protein